MNQRQRRSDEFTARAVARGLNILSVRGEAVARNYMEYRRVPAAVIARTLADTGPRRRLSPAESISEAIAPTQSEGDALP